jgi:hypothetical protein
MALKRPGVRGLMGEQARLALRSAGKQQEERVELQVVRRPLVDELERCLAARTCFWLYGSPWSGKTLRLKQALKNLANDEGRPTIERVALEESMTTSQLARALLSPLGRLESWSGEDLWTTFLDAYEQLREEVFVVFDGWQWMPPTVRHHGARELLLRGLRAGFVSRASAVSYLGVEHAVGIEHLHTEGLDDDEVQGKLEEIGVNVELSSVDAVTAGVREEVRRFPVYVAAVGHALSHRPASDWNAEMGRVLYLEVARGLLQSLSGELPRELDLLGYLRRPLPRRVFWAHFDRERWQGAVDQGLLVEHVDTVEVCPVFVEALLARKPARADEWSLLLGCLGDSYEVWPDWDGYSDLLHAFADTLRFGEVPESDGDLIGGVVKILDRDFAGYLNLARVGLLLERFEEIPFVFLRRFPVLQFRLAQCLSLAGRRAESQRLVNALLDITTDDVGKKAFLWKWMNSGSEGDVEQAITALTDFVTSKVEPGEPLDVTARVVLSRLLIGRGYYRQALPVALEGVRAAKSQVSTRDYHLLKNLYGVCLCACGDYPSGRAMMEQACDALEQLQLTTAHVEARHTMASQCFEQGDFPSARAAFHVVRPLYEALKDERNLQLITLSEAVIDVYEGKDVGMAVDLLLPPTQQFWPYLEAERAFLRGLIDRREHGQEHAVEQFEQAFDIHLRGGSVWVLRRILREYVPAIIARGDYVRARKVIGQLDGEQVREQDFGAIRSHLVDLVGWTGDLASAQRLGLDAHDPTQIRLMPCWPGVSPCPAVSQWMACWEHLLTGGDGAEVEQGMTALGALRTALEQVLEGDMRHGSRSLLLASNLPVEGTLFGFIRGLLLSVAGDPRGLNQARAEMLSYWIGLPSPLMLQQLEWWERVLERTPESAPDTYRLALGRWLECVQRWRVDRALLIDEGRGVVCFGQRQCDLGADSVNFALLRCIARTSTDRYGDSGAIIGIEEIFEEVWHRPFNPKSSKNNVYVGIRTLRQELAVLDETYEFIELERGHGYRLTSPVVWVK